MRRLVRGNHDTRAADHLGQARTVRNHDRGAARHRLEGGQPEALVPGRMGEDSSQVIDSR